uniref:eEF1A lysine and N-terminal methyltransferase n=1 Tax=Ciona intestinalis TaxID=7719 RepID=H2Y2K2_CIOIN|nr:methyltransferase-like protein 13 [Ciona intestinalis]|eukprot:XP_002130342.1 methyltransferase-like protein 13 [Ciona intestinalis]
MDLLPKVSSDFSTSGYWETFFSKRLQAFEWYGNYLELCGLLHRYIKPKDDILVIGCGNSILSEQMYNAGFNKIMNIDISQTVIKQMRLKNKDKTEMDWKVMDVTNMDFENGQYSVVLDKGTLDAMMSDDAGEETTVEKMFDEIDRVLRTGGRYICFSLAQDHIVRKVVRYFSDHQYLVRIHKVSTVPNQESTGVQMPVFSFIFTKFVKLPSKIFEVCFEDSVKPTRIQSEDEIIELTKSQQYYAMLKNQLSSETTTNAPPIELFSSEDVVNVRYTMHVVDLKDYKPKHKFGIFIIPQGRECEWLYGSSEGRRQVAESARFMRLVFVALNREHTYGGMQAIQDELSTKVLELSPNNIPENYQVPFMTDGGNDIGERTVRHRCKSDLTGGFVIEDYKGANGVWYRQLVFEDHLTSVQSVVRLKMLDKKKKRRQRGAATDNMKLVPDGSYLASNYSQLMVSGLASIIQNPSDKFRILVIGLGGGTMSLFMLHCFKQCNITAVELDASVAAVAKQWFGLSNDTYESRINITVEDGIQYVEKLANLNKTSESSLLFDVIVLDADSKDTTSSIRCPPINFMNEEFLSNLKYIMKNKSGFFLNLLCRDSHAKTEVIKKLKNYFPQIYKASCEEDVNEVLMCFNTNDGCMKEKLKVWLAKAATWEKQLESNFQDFQITDLLKSFAVA